MAGWNRRVLELLTTISAGAGGTVDIDQTTPGTTNGVQVNAALPAGTNAIGKLSPNTGVDIGDVDVTSVTPPSAVFHGQNVVTVAGTEEALATTQVLKQGVYVRALSTNTTAVWVGTGTHSSTDSYELPAGEQIFISIDDLASISIDVTTSGEGVSYLGF
jgi:hypothetical protein